MPDLPGYEVVLVARTPQASGPPLLTEIDRLIVEKIKYAEELNRAGSAALGVPIRSMTADVKDRLRDLRATPNEVRIYRSSVLQWAGELRTLGLQGQTVTLSCTGLYGYLARMGVTTDLIYNDTDQFTIGRQLAEHWPAVRPYGNYGLVTSGIGTSGVLRDRSYLRIEGHNVGVRLTELGAVDNGFDVHVDPLTRALTFTYPRRGLDLTASVFLDKLNIDSASVAQSVAPEDVVSDVSAVGTSTGENGQNPPLYEERFTASVRSSFGACWAGQTYDGVSEVVTLRGHGDAFLAPRSVQMLQPGVTVVPREGCRPGDVHAGDTVSYAYDAGLGLQSGTYRLAKVEVEADEGGRERMAMEFV